MLLAVSLPRFNLQDLGPIKRFTASATATPYGLPLDVEGYRRLSEYYRGQMPADSLIAPFCYRPLIPLAASALPFDSQTSMNVLNLLSLFGTVLILDRLMLRLGLGSLARFVGLMLFIVSFPTFYYGTIGFVDPPSVLIVSAAALLVLQGHRGLFLTLVPVGVLVKETNAVIALLPAIHSWAHGPLAWAHVRHAMGMIVVALVTAVSVRLFSPFPDPGFVWLPHMEEVVKNLSRPRAQLSLLLTLGLPGALTLAALASGRAVAVLGRSNTRFLGGGVP